MHRDAFMLRYSARMLKDKQDTAEVTLYGEIISDVKDAYKWSSEDKSAADFKKEIDKVRAAGAKKLLLRINSPGGVCSQSIAMRGILATAGFEEITIRIEGLCASAATDVATLPGARVEIFEGSEYMIHNPWNIVWGNADDLEKEAEHLRSIEKTTRGFYAQRSGQADEKIKEWMDRETWFTAEEAVQYGFADELLKGKQQAAARVPPQVMETMKAIYAHVPEAVGVLDTDSDAEGAVAAPAAAEHTNQGGEKPMEIKDLTQETLRAENPELCNALMQSAVEAERQRMQDIDDLTPDGEEYRQMAADAKKAGTSALDYHKQIVAHQRKKAQEFMASRKQETAPAAQIPGRAAEEEKMKTTEEAELKAYQAQIKALAEQTDAANERMF